MILKDCPRRYVKYAFHYTTSQLKSTLTFELLFTVYADSEKLKTRQIYHHKNMTPLNWTAVCFVYKQ